MTKKLPKPTPDVIAKYNQLIARHTQAKEAVQQARVSATRDEAAQVELGKLSTEINALTKQYDFGPPRGPLQDIIDALAGRDGSE